MSNWTSSSQGRGRLAGSLVTGVLLAPLLGIVAPTGSAQAQEAWRGLTVPKYGNATDYTARADGDEYDIHFRSPDNVRAVFDFYRGYLEQQGFRVADSRPTSRGFKANMVRAQGGPNDTVELDAKPKRGGYKVEIEFDE